MVLSFNTDVGNKGEPPLETEYHCTAFPVAIKSEIVASDEAPTQTP